MISFRHHDRRGGAPGVPRDDAAGATRAAPAGRRTLMGYSTILVDRADGVATITLNRPEARNALDLVMPRELLTALDDLEAEAATRVVILTGAGGHFSAGGERETHAGHRPTPAGGPAPVARPNRSALPPSRAPE